MNDKVLRVGSEDMEEREERRGVLEGLNNNNNE